VITRQLQIERSTGQVRRSKTDVLPLHHAVLLLYLLLPFRWHDLNVAHWPYFKICLIDHQLPPKGIFVTFFACVTLTFVSVTPISCRCPADYFCQSTSKKRAQEEPKSLPSDAFPGLQICQNCFCGQGSAPDPAGGAYSAPPDPLAGLKRPTSKGRGRGGERGRGFEGRGGGRGGEDKTNLLNS